MRVAHSDGAGATSTAGALYAYADLERDYVCNRCGGGVVHKRRQNLDTGEWADWAECARCGYQGEFIHADQYAQECADGAEVIATLPDDMLRLYGLTRETAMPAVDAQRAIDELYGG